MDRAGSAKETPLPTNDPPPPPKGVFTTWRHQCVQTLALASLCPSHGPPQKPLNCGCLDCSVATDIFSKCHCFGNPSNNRSMGWRDGLVIARVCEHPWVPHIALGPWLWRPEKSQNFIVSLFSGTERYSKISVFSKPFRRPWDGFGWHLVTIPVFEHPWGST